MFGLLDCQGYHYVLASYLLLLLEGMFPQLMSLTARIAEATPHLGPLPRLLLIFKPPLILPNYNTRAYDRCS